MEIEPISKVGGSSVTITAEQLHLAHASLAQVALGQAQAKETETTEQLANQGDPLALTRLEKEEKQITPIDEQQLLPIHPPGAHEPGKGELIDIYD